MRPLEVNINPLAGVAGFADDIARCGSDEACKQAVSAAASLMKYSGLFVDWNNYMQPGGPMTVRLKSILLKTNPSLVDYGIKYGLWPTSEGATTAVPTSPQPDPGFQLKLPESVQTFIDQAGNVVDSVTGKILKPAAQPTGQLVPPNNTTGTSAYNKPSGSTPFSFSKFMTSTTGIAVGLGLVGALGAVLVWKRKQAKKALQGLGCAVGLGSCGRARKSQKARR